MNRSPAQLGVVVVLAALAGTFTFAQVQQLPDEPPKAFGAGVTPAYEGWFEHGEGLQSFLVGYLNRNRQQEIDVPVGSNNKIEPGPPDQGQPTHFLPGRQPGMFVVSVPKGFTPAQRLTWTLTFNGQTSTIPLHLRPEYNVSPLRQDFPPHNMPPVVHLFDEKAAGIQGPVATVATAAERTASVSSPLTFTVWVDDDAKYTSSTNAPMAAPRPPVSLTWSQFRGPGKVTFDKTRAALQILKGGTVDVPYSGKASTTAQFSAPGEYVLHLIANDYSGLGGGAGEICCWTTAMVKVSVAP
jgi:hypothetical protein